MNDRPKTLLEVVSDSIRRKHDSDCTAKRDLRMDTELMFNAIVLFPIPRLSSLIQFEGRSRSVFNIHPIRVTLSRLICSTPAPRWIPSFNFLLKNHHCVSIDVRYPRRIENEISIPIHKSHSQQRTRHRRILTFN